MRRNGQNGKSGTAVAEGLPSATLDNLLVTRETVDHVLTSKGLDTLGRSEMPDLLQWYSEPIYPWREQKIQDLISRLDSLAEDSQFPELKRFSIILRGRLERAMASAQKLLEALHAAESGLGEQETQLKGERDVLQKEISDIRREIDSLEKELKSLVNEAQDIVSKAGLECNEVTKADVEQAVQKAAPTPEELAGALGVPLHAPTFWEQLSNLPTEFAPWAVGMVVGTALGLVVGFLKLRDLRDFTDPTRLVAVFILGVVIAGTMAEGLAVLVRVWIPRTVKRCADLPGQLEISQRILLAGLLLGCVFVVCEALLEALGFMHLHNLVGIEYARLAKGAGKAVVQTEVMNVATPVYICLGLVVSAPLMLLKLGRAIYGTQVALIEGFIMDRIRCWKQTKTAEVARAIVLASDSDMCRRKISDLISEKAATEQKLASLVPYVSAAQMSRIRVLEEQARGKAGKFWQLFEASVQMPGRSRLTNNIRPVSELLPECLEQRSLLSRLTERLRRIMRGRNG